jgi:hypothetical protein
MIVMLGPDFDPQKFLADLDAEQDPSKRLQAVVAVSVASLAILAERASLVKYAVADAMICHLAMMIAVETRKDMALTTIKNVNDLVKCYDPGTKH